MRKVLRVSIVMAVISAALSTSVYADYSGKGTWVNEGAGWRFLLNNGKYQHSGVFRNENETYYLDDNGYIQTGWVNISGFWFYFDQNDNGRLARSKWVDDTYVGMNGVMFQNEITPDGYVVGIDGKWTGERGETNSNKKISVNSEGIIGLTGTAMNNKTNPLVDDSWKVSSLQSNSTADLSSAIAEKRESTSGGEWIQSGDSWQYRKADGSLITNDWLKEDGKWFYFGADSNMLRHTWLNNEYYFGADGAMYINRASDDGIMVGRTGRRIIGQSIRSSQFNKGHKLETTYRDFSIKVYYDDNYFNNNMVFDVSGVELTEDGRIRLSYSCFSSSPYVSSMNVPVKYSRTFKNPANGILTSESYDRAIELINGGTEVYLSPSPNEVFDGTLEIRFVIG